MTTVAPIFTAVRLGAFYVVEHAATGRLVGRWDGAPAHWNDEDEAAEDAQRISNRERPVHCIDVLAPCDYWRN